jgi:ABC-type antimicrobial peptide transport system permease subunit
MRIVDTLLAVIILAVIVVSLMNPGGWITAAILIGLALLVRFAAPFLSELYISQNKGRRAKTARGQSDSGQSQSQSDGGRQ